MLLSLVVPMHNEETAIPPFAARVRPVVDGLHAPYEVICVDDGSTDGTAHSLDDLADQWPQLRALRLRRNAGHQEALTAGLLAAEGDYVVTIDADLQDPPELIPTMIHLAQETDSDVVYGIRTDRSSDTAFKRLTADLYYRVMQRAVGAPVPRHAGDFRLMSRAAVLELAALPESRRVYRLLVPYMGFRAASVEYKRSPRVAGNSKYPVTRMIQLAMDSYFAFTTVPLRVATWVGVFGFVASLSFAVIALLGAQAGNTIPGWASFAIVGGLFAAVQFVFLGLIGEYLARIYTELLKRPRHFVERHPRARDASDGSSDGDPATQTGETESLPASLQQHGGGQA